MSRSSMAPPDHELNGRRSVDTTDIDDCPGNAALSASRLFGGGRPARLVPGASVSRPGVHEPPSVVNSVAGQETSEALGTLRPQRRYGEAPFVRHSSTLCP